MGSAAAMNLAPSRFRGACQVDRLPGRKLQPDNETNYSYAARLFPALWDMGNPGCSVPPVVLDHVGQLDDEFALLVFLTAFEGMLLTERRRETNVWSPQSQDLLIRNNGQLLGIFSRYVNQI